MITIDGDEKRTKWYNFICDGIISICGIDNLDQDLAAEILVGLEPKNPGICDFFMFYYCFKIELFKTDNIKNKYFIYFIQSKTTGNIKIGKSINPIERIKSINGMNSDTLQIIKIIESSDTITEIGLHKQFKNLKIYRKQEWFKPTTELINFIEQQIGVCC